MAHENRSAPKRSLASGFCLSGNVLAMLTVEVNAMMNQEHRQSAYNRIQSAVNAVILLDRQIEAAGIATGKGAQHKQEQDALILQAVTESLALVCSLVEAVHVIAESAKRGNPSPVDTSHPPVGIGGGIA